MNHKIIIAQDEEQALIDFLKNSLTFASAARSNLVAQFILNSILQYALHIEALPIEALNIVKLPCAPSIWKHIASYFEKEISRYVQK